MSTHPMIRRALPLALCALAAPAAFAQQAPVKGGSPSLVFNFAPPGARSLAMGASFIGLADDATASESNPAGLPILTRPEFSAHFRTSTFDNTLPDTVDGRGFETFSSSASSPSFASVVYPWKSVAVSAYFQRAANYLQEASFSGRYRDPNFGILIDEADSASTDLQIDNVGLSLGYEVSPQLSVGASVRNTRLSVSSLERVAFLSPELPGFSTTIQGTIDDTASKVTFNAGVLFTPNAKVSVGAVYKSGGDYDFQGTLSSVCRPGGCAPDAPNGQLPVTLSVPHVFGGGVALRPTERITLTADVVRVTYSDLTAEGSLFGEFGEGGSEAIEDGTEFHLGGEYAMPLGRNVLALRAGIYTDPDHDGLAGVDSDQVHVTFGGGVVLGNRVQIDAAANLADTVREGLLSFVVRF